MVSLAMLLFVVTPYASAQDRDRANQNQVRTEEAKASAGGCFNGRCSGEGAVSNIVCKHPEPGYKFVLNSEEIHHTVRADDAGTVSPTTAVTIVGQITPDQICIIATAWPVSKDHQARVAGYATIWQKKGS